MQGPETYQGADVIVEIVNRLRVLESKNTLLSERILLINQNMIEEYKKLFKDVKAVENEIREIKNDLANVKNILKHLTEEASTFARKDELKILEKYIKLWNPLNFVTETDVKNILQHELQLLKNKEEERKTQSQLIPKEEGTEE